MAFFNNFVYNIFLCTVLALQYGFVALFSTAFTLAPIFALLHSLISIKVDGSKFLRAFRRPVPVRVPGVIAWQGIFRMITLVGVTINVCIAIL